MTDYPVQILFASEGIFLVADSDTESLHAVRDRLDQLRRVNLDERCGLLLRDVPGGMSPQEAEDLTGVPFCSFIDTPAQVERLTTWLAFDETISEDQLDHALAV
jgi:hypothetical protein